MKFVLCSVYIYELISFPDSCATIAPSPAFRGVKHISQSQDDDPGGGYSLINYPTTPTTKTDFVHQTPNYKQFSSSCGNLFIMDKLHILFFTLHIFVFVFR